MKIYYSSSNPVHTPIKFKGKSVLTPGVYYAPYIPLQVNSLVSTSYHLTLAEIEILLSLDVTDE